MSKRKGGDSNAPQWAKVLRDLMELRHDAKGAGHSGMAGLISARGEFSRPGFEPSFVCVGHLGARPPRKIQKRTPKLSRTEHTYLHISTTIRIN